VVLLSSYAAKRTLLIDKEVHRVLILAYGLLPIFLRAHAGDEGAQKQLGAIQKLILRPNDTAFKSPTLSKSLDISIRLTHGLARGMEISNLLSEVSWLVERADGSRFVPRTDDFVKLADDTSDNHFLTPERT